MERISPKKVIDREFAHLWFANFEVLDAVVEECRVFHIPLVERVKKCALSMRIDDITKKKWGKLYPKHLESVKSRQY